MNKLIKKYYSYFKRFGLIGSAKRLNYKMRCKISSFRGLPERLSIEISNVCNLDCEYCSLKSNMPVKTIMSPETFELLRPYFKHFSYVALSGLAEPLMNKNLIKFIKCIKKESPLCHVSIFSNATLLTEELSSELINSGLDVFEFSLDGADVEVVDSIRKGSSLTILLNNIKLLRDIKKNRKSRIPFICATTVLQKKNYLQLTKIIELADDLGVKSLNFNNLEPYTEDLIQNILWYSDFIPKDLSAVLEKSLELANRKGIYLGIASFFPETPTCSEITTPVVLANGDVVPCAVLAYDREQYFRVGNNNSVVMEKYHSKQKCFGNIKNRSLKDIWVSHEYMQFRKKILQRNFPSDCKYCLIKHNCICVRPGPSAKSVVLSLKNLKHL